MIDLTADELNIVTTLLAEYVPGCEVRAFGSRVNGNAKSYSDLDLVVVGKGDVDRQQMSDLREAFVESDLPFRVDLLDWARVSPAFRAVIEKGFEVIQA